MSTKQKLPALENLLTKPSIKKIDVRKFEILANKIKKYLEEEERKLREEDNGYNKKLRFSLDH